MWEVDGSDSLAAREVIDAQFGGLSSQSAAVVAHSDSLATDAAFRSMAAGMMLSVGFVLLDRRPARS